MDLRCLRGMDLTCLRGMDFDLPSWSIVLFWKYCIALTLVYRLRCLHQNRAKVRSKIFFISFGTTSTTPLSAFHSQQYYQPTMPSQVQQGNFLDDEDDEEGEEVSQLVRGGSEQPRQRQQQQQQQ
ncbi:hypothetical protein Lal_00033889 [Lupinus albus]|nr:hypothetical protein Lal_00033889 [Lupinus albus]